jgi:hypothetical protein
MLMTKELMAAVAVLLLLVAATSAAWNGILFIAYLSSR